VPDEETLSLFASIRSKKAELLRQLQSADKAEKIKAIAELAGLTYDDQVREKLKDILLKDTDPDLRKEVANAFGKSKNDTLVSILEEVRVGDDNKEVRQAADQAIKNIKGISN
jgi:HEAT repeat protein